MSSFASTSAYECPLSTTTFTTDTTDVASTSTPDKTSTSSIFGGSSNLRVQCDPVSFGHSFLVHDSHGCLQAKGEVTKSCTSLKNVNGTELLKITKTTKARETDTCHNVQSFVISQQNAVIGTVQVTDNGNIRIIHNNGHHPQMCVLSLKMLEFDLCFEGMYEPLVFLKNPHPFHGSLVFGDSQNTKKCPKDKSRFDMTFMYGTVSNAMSVYDERTLEQDGTCPREILRFDPPPKLSYCSSDEYRPITTIAEFATRLKFSNMPVSFENFIHRTERIVSTFSRLDRMPNLMDGLNVSVKAPYYESSYELTINDELFLIPNFNKYFDVLDQFDDVKFETGAYWSQRSQHYGFERICSQVDANLTTFDDTVLNTTELARDHNCWTLLAADCSDQSRISVFTKPSGNGSIAIKVYAGDDTLEYHPHENAEQIMTVNSEHKFKLHAMDSKEISLLSTLTPIKINFNEENVLVLETENSMTVQYNLNNMLTFSVYSFYKGQVCGLCAASSNSDGFKLCS